MRTISLYEVVLTVARAEAEQTSLSVIAFDESDASETARVYETEQSSARRDQQGRLSRQKPAASTSRVRSEASLLRSGVGLEEAETLLGSLFGNRYYQSLRAGLSLPDDDLHALRDRIISSSMSEGGVFFVEDSAAQVLISNEALLAVRAAVCSVAQEVRPEQLLEAYSSELDDGRSYDEGLYIRASEIGKSQSPEELARGLARLIARARTESYINGAGEEYNCHPAISFLASRLAAETQADNLVHLGAAEEACETNGHLHKMYGEALAVQEATDVLGVIKALADRLDALVVSSHGLRQPVASHPVLRLFAHKIHSLVFMGEGRAESECRRRLIVARARLACSSDQMVVG